MTEATRNEIACTRDWTDDYFNTYFTRYIDKGLAITDGSGYCIGRPVAQISTGVDDRFAVDWKGKYMWVESVIGCPGKMGEALAKALSLLKSYGCSISMIVWNRTHLGRPEPVVMNIERIIELL